MNELLTRMVAEVQVRTHLEEKLQSGKKLRIKLGIDPTGFDLTLGHAVVLRKLKQFQQAGHQIVLLFGTFTAKIGDPTGKSQTRDPLTLDQILENKKNYLEQAAKIIDIEKAEIVHNGDWLASMSFEDILQLAGNFTVAQMIERDMFQERMKKDLPINLVEFMYPLMQGYDSVPIRADVELGGTDQLFNMMCARPIQKRFGMEPQDVMTVPILVGLDGKEKMSKSLNNYIAIMDSAKEMFGKTMSIPDDVILNYFELATEVPLEEIAEIQKQLESGINPRDIKIRLAKEIVALYHSKIEADKEEQTFKEVFSQNQIPDDIEEIVLQHGNIKLWDFINQTSLCSSSSESKRMIQQGSVKINSVKKDTIDEIIHVQSGMVVQIGKRKWIKVK